MNDEKIEDSDDRNDYQRNVLIVSRIYIFFVILNVIMIIEI
jgi:hypothetical protein